MCVWLVGVFPWCVGVEFVPVDAGAVSGGDAEDLLPSFVAAFPCLSVEVFDLFVAPRMRGQPCGVFGVCRVLVAPPAHGLDATEQAQAAVVPEHGADACVLRFDGVVGGRHGCRGAQFGVHEGEHGPLAYAAAHGVARFDEALVQVVLAAVGPDAFLLEEVLVPRLPRGVGDQPGGHGVAVVHAGEVLGQAQQLPERLVARVRAEYGADVEAAVEQAALHTGAGPCVPEGLADAAAPVAYDGHGFDRCGPSGSSMPRWSRAGRRTSRARAHRPRR